MRQWGRIATVVLACWPGATQGQDRSTGPGFEILGSAFVAIQTADVRAAAPWCESILGLGEVDRIDEEEGGHSLRLLTGSGLTVELLKVRGTPPPPPRHLGLFKAGFHVDDIVAAHRWLRTNGADADPAIFVDRALQARSLVFRDLEGNRLQVFQRCREAC